MSGAGETRHELLVVGGGPAGLAAATEAARLGVDVVLVDEQPAPGGQIYRAIETTPAETAIGAEYIAEGRRLASAFRASGALYRPGTAVWEIAEAEDGENGFWVGLLAGGEASALTARRIVLAAGALERPVPIPGWTLPGVMTVGAAQTVLKASGAVPGPETVLAGTGPLLYLFAAQVLAAGGTLRAILDTRAPGALSRALPLLPAALLSGGGIAKGLGLLSTIRRAGIRHEKGVVALEAQGREAVEAVRFRRADGTGGRIETGLLLLHQGVIPMTQMSRALRLDHAWDPVRLAFHPMTDHFGRSSLPGVLVAGDGAGVEGAEAAALRGHLAALAVAESLGSIEAKTRDREARTPLKALARHRRLRPFLDVLYRPADGFRVPADDRTIVCRCEELSAGELRAAVRRGGRGPNQLKSFVRCGMGPCQGRLCGPTVTELVAAETGRTPGEVGSYRIRPPYRPLTLGALAALDAPRVAADAPEASATLPLEGLNRPERLTGFPSLDRQPT